MDIKRCNGKIYTIRSYETELIYVGSTTEKRLSARFSKHKASYKIYSKSGKNYTTACEILKYSDAYIELVREVLNCTKDELRKIEGQYTREIKCVNKNIAGQTQKEYKDTHKEQIKEYYTEYYTENKDEILKKTKEYKDTHKEQIKEQNKEYYTDNKDKYKKYYAENKDEIQQQKSSKYICECGKELTSNHKARHNKVCKFNSKAI